MGARYFIDGKTIVAPQASRLPMVADGSATIEGRSGTLEFRETSTTTTTTRGTKTTVSLATKYDDDGNGTYERSQTIATTTAADGNSTRLIRTFDVSGAMDYATKFATPANLTNSLARSITTSLDQNGDVLFHEVQGYSRDVAGDSQTMKSALATNCNLGKTELQNAA